MDFVSNECFQKVMGPASTGGKQLRYDSSELPLEWTENAFTPGSRSRRRQNNFQVTKNVISHSMKKGNNRKKNITS